MRVLVAKGENGAMAVNDGNKCYHSTEGTEEAWATGSCSSCSSKRL
jgi:hypothetical protein